MPPRCLPDASQVLPRCFPDASHLCTLRLHISQTRSFPGSLTRFWFVFMALHKHVHVVSDQTWSSCSPWDSHNAAQATRTSRRDLTWSSGAGEFRRCTRASNHSDAAYLYTSIVFHKMYLLYDVLYMYVDNVMHSYCMYVCRYVCLHTRCLQCHRIVCSRCRHCNML